MQKNTSPFVLSCPPACPVSCSFPCPPPCFTLHWSAPCPALSCLPFPTRCPACRSVLSSSLSLGPIFPVPALSRIPPSRSPYPTVCCTPSCPALPCTALPCPALPCPLLRLSSTLSWRVPSALLCFASSSDLHAALPTCRVLRSALPSPCPA